MPVGRPFQPGQSGNPSGFSKAQREVMEALQGDGPSARTKMLDLMKCGDLKVEYQAAKTILEYAVGKPKELVELSGSGLKSVLRDLMMSPGPDEPADTEE